MMKQKKPGPAKGGGGKRNPRRTGHFGVRWGQDKECVPKSMAEHD